tara:strand:- start:2072 stop:3292 length:1221 start_codon:yes stop_codon:yes gene_type:complete
MQNTNLGNFMNELSFKAQVPYRLLTLAQQQENPEQFLKKVFQENNYEELIKQEFNLKNGKLKKKVAVKDYETENLHNQLTEVDQKVIKVSNEAARAYKEAEDFFHKHIDSRNIVFKDACESLKYFYREGHLEKGIAHQLNNFKNKRIKSTEDVKVSQTITYHQIENLTNLTPREKRQLQEREGIEVIVESVESQTNLAGIVAEFCNMYYSYIEQYDIYQNIKKKEQIPLKQKTRLSEDAKNNKQRALMRKIVVGLSPIRKGADLEEIYEFEPLYYLFIGNQNIKSLEFPTTLSMHIFNRICEALVAISRLKTAGQKQSPKILRDIAEIIPEAIGDDEKATDIHQKWFNWKFDLYSIQQGVYEILQKRVNGQEILTSSSQINIIANKIGKEEAALALSIANQQTCAA